MSDPLLFWGRVTRPSMAMPGAQTQGNLYFLSNFYPVSITRHHKSYPSSEHLYQALKFEGTDDEHAEAIRRARTPTECKRLARSSGHPIRPGWDEERVDVMREVLALKFDQHPDLRRKLMETGNRPLWEDARDDLFWGAGTPRKRGQNWLGRLLMELRSEYHEQKRAAQGDD